MLAVVEVQPDEFLRSFIMGFFVPFQVILPQERLAARSAPELFGATVAVHVTRHIPPIEESGRAVRAFDRCSFGRRCLKPGWLNGYGRRELGQ